MPIEVDKDRYLEVTKDEDTERNAGIASMLTAGQSWSFIQDMTGCSRATIAKIAKRIAAPEVRTVTA